ncbi:MAG: caspase family protein [Planctomycetota bacterium]|jgi:hypothetical protein
MKLKENNKISHNNKQRINGPRLSGLVLFVVVSLVNLNSLGLAQSPSVDGRGDDDKPSGVYEDQYEPNNNWDEAAVIQNGQYSLDCGDEDWFVFELTTSGQITVTVDGVTGDLDLYLFDGNGNQVATSANYDSYEQVSVTGQSGIYFIAVAPYEYQDSSYTLTVNIPNTPVEQPEPNNPDNNSNSGTPAKRALLVGIDHYDPYYGASSLPSCVNDAKGMRDTYLADTPTENITLLTDGQATREAIRNALQSMAYQAGPNDEIVYFHSSHGGQSYGTDTYLCTYNADYTDTELGYDLALFSAGQKVIVIVDACYSGGLYKNAEWPLARRIMKTFKTQKMKQLQARGAEVPRDLGANIAFITACNYNQTCDAGAVYSLFTEYLIKAGSVISADSNGDGQFQYWEIYNYAADEASYQNSGQTAQFSNQTLLENTVAKNADGVGNGFGLVMPATCGAGATQTLTIGLLGLMGLITTRRSWTG